MDGEGVVDAETVADGSQALARRFTSGVALHGEDDELTQALRAHLTREAAEKAKRDQPEATRRAFAQDWALWTRFIDHLNKRTGAKLGYVRDATAGQLVAFVGWLDTDRKAAVTSMPRRLTGIRAMLRDVHGKELSPEDLKPARKAIKALRTASGGQDTQQQKADRAVRIARERGRADIVTPDDVRRMVEAAPGYQPLTGFLSGQRAAALAALSFAIAARVAETSALSVADVLPEGKGLMVDVPAVKGGTGRKVYVPPSVDPTRCPVRLWNVWREESGLGASDPAFPAFTPQGNLTKRYVTAESIRSTLTALADRAGLTDTQGLPLHVTGHSFRRGYITQAARDKTMSHQEIARQSGHSPTSPEFLKYIELADRLDGKAVL